MRYSAVPVKVKPVDPRDVGTEVESPAYHVYFWQPLGGGYRSDEYEVDEADVTEVIAWARAEANVRSASYTLYVVVEGDNKMLVRLYGAEPTLG